MTVEIFFHDPAEVDPLTSWTGLCAPLSRAVRVDITKATNPAVTALFDYARPDVVVAVDGKPVVSIEQTAMNPSGHNIPQRFSFQVRAAELGVPSILYYPEKSRRTYSDPNERYINPRVPLAQRRLTQLFRVPALSSFWPTDHRKLPDPRPAAQRQMAELVAALINGAGSGAALLARPEVKHALAEMDRVVAAYSTRIRENASVRCLVSEGYVTAEAAKGLCIDPPPGARLENTAVFLMEAGLTSAPPALRAKLSARRHTLVFTGTANKMRTDSEHPWPGYLSLIDILYCRTGRTPLDRHTNLAYRLPVTSSTYLSRANKANPPTATYIVDTFADVLVLNDGLVPGRPLRGSTHAQRV